MAFRLSASPLRPARMVIGKLVARRAVNPSVAPENIPADRRVTMRERARSGCIYWFGVKSGAPGEDRVNLGKSAPLGRDISGDCWGPLTSLERGRGLTPCGFFF